MNQGARALAMPLFRMCISTTLAGNKRHRVCFDPWRGSLSVQRNKRKDQRHHRSSRADDVEDHSAILRSLSDTNPGQSMNLISRYSHTYSVGQSWASQTPEQPVSTGTSRVQAGA
jgi:hypothetical protein